MQKYIIKQKIGTGSFGEVFLLHDLKRNQKLALKRFKTHYDNEQQIKQMTQVKILNRLKHPNVIDLKQIIYQKQSQKGSLVFQYCYSDILKKFCYDKKQRAAQIQIKKVIFEIASALSFVHSKNYIHRDLKPENILLQEKQFEGKVYDVAKLCDFGISKKSDELPLTQYIGTRWYRAPQLLIKTKNYTKAVDIFSLGCIMAEIYNRQILFQGKNVSEQLLLIMKKLGTPTKQSWPQFSNWCQLKGIIFGKYQKSQDSIIFKAKPQDLAQDLIQKMLVMNPKNRITATDILKHPYFNEVKFELLARQYAAQPLKLSDSSAIMQTKEQNPQQNQKQQNLAKLGQKTREQTQSGTSDKSKILILDINEQKVIQNNVKILESPKQELKSPNTVKVQDTKLLKKPPSYYSPYSLTVKKQPSVTSSAKKFDYFQTYVSGKNNEDRIRTTYQLHKNQDSRDSSFKNSNQYISGK